MNDNRQYFDAILKSRLAKTEQILASKAKEYAGAKDLFHNFRVAGMLLGVTPEKALLGMMAKHIVSVVDMVNGSTAAKVTPEMIDEKIGDSINYMILLEGMMKQRITLAEKAMANEMVDAMLSPEIGIGDKIFKVSNFTPNAMPYKSEVEP